MVVDVGSRQSINKRNPLDDAVQAEAECWRVSLYLEIASLASITSRNVGVTSARQS
jgi:hypothetical protein